MINSAEKQVSTQEETRLKRLRYRSWHRGCKETDLVLGNFADNRLEMLDSETLDVFERLLEENDADIWNWLMGKPAPEKYKLLLKILSEIIIDK